jgi:hypothetical protein
MATLTATAMPQAVPTLMVAATPPAQRLSPATPRALRLLPTLRVAAGLAAIRVEAGGEAAEDVSSTSNSLLDEACIT